MYGYQKYQSFNRITSFLSQATLYSGTQLMFGDINIQIQSNVWLKIGKSSWREDITGKMFLHTNKKLNKQRRSCNTTEFDYNQLNVNILR